MGIFDKKIVNVAEKVADIADRFITTKGEKGEMLKQIQTEINSVTETRMRLDMASDSWLSKNIRPLTLLIIVGGYFLLNIVVTALGAFEISLKLDPEFISILKGWGSTVISFYFGFRGAEKIAELFTKKRRN